MNVVFRFCKIGKRCPIKYLITVIVASFEIRNWISKTIGDTTIGDTTFNDKIVEYHRFNEKRHDVYIDARIPLILKPVMIR